MIAIVDVQYAEIRARAGCVIAHAWRDAAPAAERMIDTEVAAAYVPGEFYRRELPPVLDILRDVTDLAIVVIDAHVWLGPDRLSLHCRWLAVLAAGTCRIREQRAASAVIAFGGPRPSGQGPRRNRCEHGY